MQCCEVLWAAIFTLEESHTINCSWLLPVECLRWPKTRYSDMSIMIIGDCKFPSHSLKVDKNERWNHNRNSRQCAARSSYVSENFNYYLWWDLRYRHRSSAERVFKCIFRIATCRRLLFRFSMGILLCFFILLVFFFCFAHLTHTHLTMTENATRANVRAALPPYLIPLSDVSWVCLL